MWFLIIIAFIIFIIWKFSSDKTRLNKETAQLGGMSQRYFTLINILMQGDPECEIFENTPNSIAFGIRMPGSACYFTIIQLFNEILIKWHLESPVYGSHSKTWKFKEPINLQTVGMKILSDIEESPISPI